MSKFIEVQEVTSAQKITGIETKAILINILSITKIAPYTANIQHILYRCIEIQLLGETKNFVISTNSYEDIKKQLVDNAIVFS